MHSKSTFLVLLTSLCKKVNKTSVAAAL